MKISKHFMKIKLKKIFILFEMNMKNNFFKSECQPR